MRMTKSLAYEHRAKKNRINEGDIMDKFKVIRLLKQYFNLVGITGETIFIPDSKPVQYHRMPDIIIPDRKIVIELDGPIHGSGDEITKRTKDKTRDQDYAKAGYFLIIINKEQTKGYKEALILNRLNRDLI